MTVAATTDRCEALLLRRIPVLSSDSSSRLFRFRRKAVRCSGDSDAIELAVNAGPEGLLFCVAILMLKDRRFLPAHPGFRPEDRGRDTRVI